MKKSFYLVSTLFIWSFASGQPQTPFEKGNGNQTTTYEQCINYYRQLAILYDEVGLYEYGKTDSGKPLHLVVVSDQPVPDQSQSRSYIKSLKNQKKAIFMVMNGIHPGEPCGIDASMMLARDLAKNKDKVLKDVVMVIIPVYNIGGALNRGSFSRANQIGPESHGFRGNAKNLDLNRDFIKADSKNTWAFWQMYHEWNPDVFLDNHTTNGSDHQYTMTLIQSQKDKQDAGVKDYMETMVPLLYKGMKNRGDEMSPYVNVHGTPLERRFTGFLETPRYSTGYTTLFGTVSFVAEAHMLKPFKNRVESTYRLMETFLETISVTKFDLLKRNLKTLQAESDQQMWPLRWELDTSLYETLKFKGYHHVKETSKVTGQERYRYETAKPYKENIRFYNTYKVSQTTDKPFAYIIPQAWDEVIERLKANRCLVKQLAQDTALKLEYYYVENYETVKQPYEGHYLHNDVEVRMVTEKVRVRAGDYMVILPNRFAIETLEPMAHDAFFCWNFFDATLQQKEWFSGYLFEEKAEELLTNDADLKARFEVRKKEDAKFRESSFAQLYFIYRNSPYYEPSHNRLPVYRLQEVLYLPTID